MTCLTGPETEGSDPRSRRMLDALTQLAASDPPSERTLSDLCRQAAEMLRARGLALAAVDDDPRRPWLVTGSDPDARGLVAGQFDLEEGPCLDAWRSGEPVGDRCVTADGRWPRWIPQALEAGVDGVLSVPLGETASGRPLGTLWLAFDRAEGLDDSLLRWVAAVAQLALRELARHRELEQRRAQVSQLEHALQSRVVIEQAKGFIAAREGVSPEEAFERLRRRARSSQRRLRDVAQETVRQSTAPSA